MTSATYRQAAITTPEKLEKDRDNRLMSRGPRFGYFRDVYFLSQKHGVEPPGGPEQWKRFREGRKKPTPPE